MVDYYSYCLKSVSAGDSQQSLVLYSSLGKYDDDLRLKLMKRKTHNLWKKYANNYWLNYFICEKKQFIGLKYVADFTHFLEDWQYSRTALGNYATYKRKNFTNILNTEEQVSADGMHIRPRMQVYPIWGKFLKMYKAFGK